MHWNVLLTVVMAALQQSSLYVEWPRQFDAGIICQGSIGSRYHSHCFKTRTPIQRRVWDFKTQLLRQNTSDRLPKH